MSKYVKSTKNKPIRKKHHVSHANNGFCLVCLDISFDLFSGLPVKEMVFDLILESSILLSVFFTARYMWKKIQAEKQDKKTIKKSLADIEQIAKKWEKKSKFFVKEFQQFILTQFSSWGLSRSETEIAILLLKGMTSKQISSVRYTSERTIRNQCNAIYEKSNLAGRNELTAFFLNELVGDLGQEQTISPPPPQS